MRTNVICPKCKTDNTLDSAQCTRCKSPLIGDEVLIMNKIGALWDQFSKLTELNTEEKSEFKLAIYRLQGVMTSRIATKIVKGILKKKDGK